MNFFYILPHYFFGYIGSDALQKRRNPHEKNLNSIPSSPINLKTLQHVFPVQFFKIKCKKPAQQALYHSHVLAKPYQSKLLLLKRIRLNRRFQSYQLLMNLFLQILWIVDKLIRQICSLAFLYTYSTTHSKMLLP